MEIQIWKNILWKSNETERNACVYKNKINETKQRHVKIDFYFTYYDSSII